MPTLEDLAGRIDKLEKQQSGRWRVFVQYLISPAILVIIGYLLNLQVEEAKQGLQRIEVDVKRIEAAQGMLSELFSDVPERAFIADRLMGKLVDSDLSEEISKIVTAYYTEKLNQALDSDEALDEAEEITSAAKAIGGPAAERLVSKIEASTYYVVVASIPHREKARAIQLANSLTRNGYSSEVHYSTTGFYAVTIGHLPLAEAKALRREAIDEGHGPKDTYLTPGPQFKEKIYPRE